MSTSIPTILPKLLALAGSPNAFEAAAALRKARTAVGGDWSVVTGVTRWMIDDQRLGRLLDRVATGEADQSTKALRDAQKLMAKVDGLDFQFLSRKVAELQKAPRRRVRSLRTRPTSDHAAAPAAPVRVTEATWAEVFALAETANADRPIVKMRRRGAPRASAAQQLLFAFMEI